MALKMTNNKKTFVGCVAILIMMVVVTLVLWSIIISSGTIILFRTLPVLVYFFPTLMMIIPMVIWTRATIKAYRYRNVPDLPDNK